MRIQLKLFKQCKASDVDGRQPQNAPFGEAAGAECAFRLSVECAFPHLGKRGAASRKSALWPDRLTERRALCAEPHQKAHSGLIDSCKGALRDPQIAQTAPFRHAAAPGRCGATTRQAAGHYGECLNWANALEQPPASLRGGLCQCPQISVRSLTSRKGAFRLRALTELRGVPAPSVPLRTPTG